ncbi:type III toxin-antitoxin system TenpIN family toxin [Bacillus cereus]|uniref:type III toxin-antitoxin system TenpIN family toxin n=1 Tax=Bacillus cereus TaxID=1396 RepID=UPI0021125D78|nr:hypothetical protein [Bacillus cereus]MCQ6294609.1 hypothetical protein [Bacillus cereus]
MSKSIEFYRLSNDFYNENTHLVEIMDKEKDGSFKNKERGYGVFLVDIDGLKFALPLRSKMHIKHKGKDVRHGLDYSKAIIITEERFVDTSRIFILENKSDYVKINKDEHHIIKTFEKYVSRYKQGIKKNDSRILAKYRYSTLKNYHAELGLPKLIHN